MIKSLRKISFHNALIIITVIVFIASMVMMVKVELGIRALEKQIEKYWEENDVKYIK